jgi:hypothetical protein
LTHRLRIKDTETGPGVFETALAYTNVQRMADNATLFKFTAKSLGMKHGVLPSFMAKPWENVSVLSLYDNTSPNIFCSYQDAAGKQLLSAYTTLFTNPDKTRSRLVEKFRREEYIRNLAVRARERWPG